jgi:hypothetical protein
MVSGGRVHASVPDDPLLQDVELRDVHIARSRDLKGNTFGGRPLMETDATAVALIRDDVPRSVLFAFDLHDSDLPLRTGFPILVDHLSSWLLPEAVVPRPYRPDESVLISPDVHATAVRVVKPGGRSVDLAVRQGSTVAAQVFADTDEVGVYRVEQKVAGNTVTTRFAVNAASSEQSSIAPLARLALSGTTGPGRNGPAAEFSEWWPWLALGALALLGAEWVVFHRGI